VAEGPLSRPNHYRHDPRKREVVSQAPVSRQSSRAYYQTISCPSARMVLQGHKKSRNGCSRCKQRRVKVRGRPLDFPISDPSRPPALPLFFFSLFCFSAFASRLKISACSEFLC